MKRWTLWSLAALAVLTLGAGLFLVRPATSADQWAEFAVDKLSCGSCVAKIQDELAAIPGVGEVTVDLDQGQARVAYDAQQVAPELLAERISALGYPARLQRTLSAAALQADRESAAQLAVDHVGRIGDRLVSRTEFDAAVAALRPQDLPAAREGALRQAVWADMIETERLLAAATANGVVVQEDEVAAEIAAMRAQRPDFDAQVARRFGSLEAFTARVKTQLIIDRNIMQHVLKDVPKAERKEAFERWYATLAQSTPVEVFDAALQPAGSGCGGNCCATKPPAS